MDEVRVWKVARTTEQIREDILKQLTGNEPGLVALWNFDDPANPGRDASRNHRDGKLMGNARAAAASTVATAAQNPGPFAGTGNRVLELDGNGSAVELPPDIIRGLEELTVEIWVRCDEFRTWSRYFSFGEGHYRLGIMNDESNGGQWSAVDSGKNATGNVIAYGVRNPSALTAGQWAHMAVVVGKDGMSFYVNGVLAGKEPRALLSLFKGDPHNRLGAVSDDGSAITEALHGALDEVRVWKVARTIEQIRENIAKPLTGSEPGLVALWNFDDPANPGRDASPNHHDGKLMGNARAVSASQEVENKAGLFSGINRALDLDGIDSGVELPPGIFNDLSEVTVEGWVNWGRFQSWSRFFDFGKRGTTHPASFSTFGSIPPGICC